MQKEYVLDAEDEKIVNELDNLYGVAQNKEILKNIILYSKLRENEEIDFGNYNMIVRNNSSYNLLNDLLKVYGKVLLKYNIIKNDEICVLHKISKARRSDVFDKIEDINESIIVMNESKLRLNYSDEIENLQKLVNTYNDKIFIFEDTGFCNGEADSELGDLASFRMTIEKISIEDKITYCKNTFDKNNLKYKEEYLEDFSDQPFWQLKNVVMHLMIECKSKGISKISKKMLEEKLEKADFKNLDSKDNKTKKSSISENIELDELFGLYEVKQQVNKILNYIKVNKKRGKMPSLNMCFNGNPGTGKTSVARAIGKIFEEENILSGNGKLVEIHGRDLVDKYVGWTAKKVQETVKKAIGGVLFIDEAYSLVSDRKGSFEDEAIATLIKEMEDHRDEVCIILAGYTEEMKALIESNPGFESRIQFTINFPDYNEEELFEIFKAMCKKENYKLSKNCKEMLIDNFKNAREQEHFGNGRYVRNIFEKIKFEQADRIVKFKNKSINMITLNDVKNVLNTMELKNTKETRRIGFI